MQNKCSDVDYYQNHLQGRHPGHSVADIMVFQNVDGGEEGGGV